MHTNKYTISQLADTRIFLRATCLPMSTLFMLALLFTATSNTAYAAACGAEGQSGCKITFKRPKTCDKGLHYSLKTKLCVRNKGIAAIKPPKLSVPSLPEPKPPVVDNCGKLGQKGCRISFKRPKSCDKGLHLNLKAVCVQNKKLVIKPSEFPIKQAGCGALGQPGCTLTALRVKSCDIGLKRNKDTGICEHGKIFRAAQNNCGGLNQKPCLITATRYKACDFGYKQNKSKTLCMEGGLTLRPVSAECGALDQRACRKTEAAFSCKKGLRRDPPSGYCVERRKVDKAELRRAAKILIDESTTLIKGANVYRKCIYGDPAAFVNPDFQKYLDKVDLVKRAVKDKDVSIAIALAMSDCAAPLLRTALTGGYETFTVGMTGGAGLGLGGFADNGFAFHTPSLLAFVDDPTNNKFPMPTFYQTKAVSAGIQAGASAGLSIGFYKDPARHADIRGTDTHGITAEAIGAAGAGVGAWFTYDGEVDGVSVAALIGLEGSAGAYNKVNTSFYSLEEPRSNQKNCGGADERACKIWENAIPCDPGLDYDFETSRCYAKKPSNGATAVSARTVLDNGLDCGAAGQRVCRVHEQIPGCNAGLRIDFQAKVCAY